MPAGAEVDRLAAAWRTNNRATVYLVEHLPASIWSSRVRGIPSPRTRAITGVNCAWWLASLGGGYAEGRERHLAVDAAAAGDVIVQWADKVLTE